MADQIMTTINCNRAGGFGAMNIVMRNLCSGSNGYIYSNCNMPYYGSEEMAEECIPVMEKFRGTPLIASHYGSAVDRVFRLYPSMSRCNTTDASSDEGAVFDRWIDDNEYYAKKCVKELKRITGQEFEAVMTEYCSVFSNVWTVKKNKNAFLGDIYACDCHDPQQVADQIISRNDHEGEYHVAGIIHDMLGCSIYCATEKTLDDFKAGIYTSIFDNFSLAIVLLGVCDKYNCNESF